MLNMRCHVNLLHCILSSTTTTSGSFASPLLQAMPEPLPLELLEAIVDNVALDKTRTTNQDLLSLCLCSKAFVSRTQIYLYSDVIIHLANDQFYDVPNTPYSALLRRTVTLITTLRTHPHLKLHITTLRCKLLVPIRGGSGNSTVVNVSKFIAEMVNIRKFVLGFDAGTSPSSINFGVIAPGVLRGAIASLLQRPQLIEYTLHNV